MYTRTIKENETVTELEQAPYKMDSNERNLRNPGLKESQPYCSVTTRHQFPQFQDALSKSVTPSNKLH
jgi:hypothetical protein